MIEEAFDRYYQAERRMGWLFAAGSLLAVFISCLGLFGLAVFTAELRTKEVGIRKVMGASVIDIVTLLSGSFLKPVLIATLIATPIAWYGMGRWLDNFAYRTNAAWWIFIAAGILALLIAFFTVSVQSIRVAMANPVDALRSE
jgi:putative ABC transport system permease protein